MKSLRLLYAFSLLILASLACNLLTQVRTPEGESPGDILQEGSPVEPDAGDRAAAPQSDGTAQDGEAPPPQITGEPFNLDSASLQVNQGRFNTYRAALVHSFTSADGITGTLTMQGATMLEPFATDFHFNTSGKAAAGLGADFSYVKVNDTEYISSPDFGCQAGLTNLALNPFEITLDTGGMLTGQAQFLGEETVNGLNTRVYALTTDNLNPTDPAQLGIRTLSTGRLYLASDGGFPVRIFLEGTGINQGLSGSPDLQGTIRYDLNYFDFDQPVAVSIPEGCTKTEEIADSLPLPEDARGITRFVDFVNFTTSRSMEELAAFYEAQMPVFSCTDPEVIGDGVSMTAMTFSNCSFGSAQIVMTVETQGETNATIFIMP